VALRRFHPGGVAGFAAYRSSVPAARFQGWDAPFPREEGERSARELATGHPGTPGAWFRFAVALRPGGRLAGGGAVMPQAGGSRQGKIGVTIAPGYQGHGYAAGAVRLLPGCLFTARGRHRITACCDPREAAPAALPERPGMRREGHLRQSTRAEGGWTGDLVYALLHEEWQSG